MWREARDWATRGVCWKYLAKLDPIRGLATCSSGCHLPFPADLLPEIPLRCMGMEQGSVKWFSDTKGYGVILRDTGGEIFVHLSAMLGGSLETLQAGQRVQYLAIRGLKGLQAEGVQGV